MSEHAVLVHLSGSLEPTDLADVADLEDVLIDAIGQIGAGELDGHEWISTAETLLFTPTARTPTNWPGRSSMS
ncbi:hypothetical protein [Actinophytocola glycyrrhizae]|uniref:Uncharacterized protein n=1 Tax=Actinophytocola glycyrrhizae TaxID=2044873 RepID=A0ABV9RUL0_9PSEU